MRILKHNNLVDVLIIATVINCIECDSHRIMKGNPVYIQTEVNHSKLITLPFHQTFAFKVNANNSQYFDFTPKSLEVTRAAHSISLPTTNITLLENLRIPSIHQYKNIQILKNYILVLLHPNKITILQQTNQSFSITNNYVIQEIQPSSIIKMYQFNQSVFIYLYNTNSAFLLDHNGYTKYLFNNTIQLAHLFYLHQMDFITAEYGSGLGIYRLHPNNQTIQLLSKYGTKQLGFQKLYLTDISLLSDSQTIYLLDQNLGILRVHFGEERKVLDSQILLSQKDCNAMDTVSENHFVLVCMSDSISYLLQVYEQIDEDGNKIFNRKNPIFHQFNFNDLAITNNFSLVFSESTIDVFWNSKANHVSQPFLKELDLHLTDLQTFKIHSNGKQVFLYTIQSGLVNKYLLKQSQAQLYIKSDHVLQKTLLVQIYGVCQDEQQKLESISKICIYEQEIELQVVEFSGSNKEWSIGAGVIVLLVVVIMVIIWICIKKYTSLEAEARKVLSSYKKKKPVMKFTI